MAAFGYKTDFGFRIGEDLKRTGFEYSFKDPG
jgi:hypothetical protein